MTFAEAFKAACLMSAKALGADIQKLSWLLRNQDPKDHAAEPTKKVA